MCSCITCSLAITLPLKYGELDNEYKLEHRDPMKTGGDRGENKFILKADIFQTACHSSSD